ncbi:conserved hypothetical protein [Paraburkholderia piptadeniae]|uniref:Uncharacterized protein n=1 Tax=Paraburkholderia piptadeniae TaxID=1701573 RepID=A0A1N7S8U2_9BURK|nr:hypothetical protein [Paraburkholderia piptadeniae]SIT43743.1 conserved hypothetical protein [Paraburkholderia piptadeniae]
MTTSEKFDQWAIIELFGHSRIAGRVTEQTVGGCAFVRVDVPAFEATGHSPATQAFTKLFGQGAIYSMSFVDEGAANMVGRQLRIQPIDTYSLRQALQDLPVDTGRDRQSSFLEDQAS